MNVQTRSGDRSHRKATYQDVLDAPPHMVAEVLAGTLHVQPRPAMRHARASSVFGYELTGPFDRGIRGPGGWWILDEPELHLGDDIVVPDLAGWRRETMPEFPDAAYCTIPPDWACEVLSPSTRRIDQNEKRAIYARVQDYEDVQFRVTDGGRTIYAHNPTGRTIDEMMVETAIPVGAPEQAGPDALGAAAVVDEGETAPEAEYASLRLEVGQEANGESRYLGHIVKNRFFTLPRLEPGASCTIRLEGDGGAHPFVAQANSKSMRFVDVRYASETRELTIHARVIRYQGLVVQGYRPGDRAHVEVDGVARQPLKSTDGRLVLYLQGPENRFVDQTIVVRQL